MFSPQTHFRSTVVWGPFFWVNTDEICASNLRTGCYAPLSHSPPHPIPSPQFAPQRLWGESFTPVAWRWCGGGFALETVLYLTKLSVADIMAPGTIAHPLERARLLSAHDFSMYQIQIQRNEIYKHRCLIQTTIQLTASLHFVYSILFLFQVVCLRKSEMICKWYKGRG